MPYHPHLTPPPLTGRKYWNASDYGVWVGGGTFEQVFSSQDARWGGFQGEHAKCNADAGEKPSYDGKLWINLPQQGTLIFKQVS